ncbi:MAG: hypothetical protein M0Z36_04150 [Thermaerobacter sp.]|nr:hypothetical protein [Thermaerobacter sp.]
MTKLWLTVVFGLSGVGVGLVGVAHHGNRQVAHRTASSAAPLRSSHGSEHQWTNRSKSMAAHRRVPLIR